MRGGREEESVYALGGGGSSGAPRSAPLLHAGLGGAAGPRVATYRAGSGAPRVKMHVDSSQVESCINPVRGVRDAQRRAGIKPTDHARQNLMAVKERSRLNALRRLSQEEEELQQGDAPARPPRRAAAPSAPGGLHPQRSGGSGGSGGGGGGGQLGRNFVEENKVAAASARAAAKAEARPVTGGAEYMAKREYGQVPVYLVERKLQMAAELRAREAAREAAKIPPGMRLMPDAERFETLELLARNREEVEAQLAALPIIADTHSSRRRKDDLERRLAEIEEAVRIFSRKQVLVRM